MKKFSSVFSCFHTDIMNKYIFPVQKKISVTYFSGKATSLQYMGCEFQVILRYGIWYFKSSNSGFLIMKVELVTCCSINRLTRRRTIFQLYLLSTPLFVKTTPSSFGTHSQGQKLSFE